MDYTTKIYIDYSYSKNKYYDDTPVEQEIQIAKEDLVNNLTETQIALLENYLSLTKKLQTYKDLHLIEYVINYTKN